MWEKKGARLLVHDDLQGSTRYLNYLEDYGPYVGGLGGSDRHRYAIAGPDKLGTDPMAYGGRHHNNMWTPPRKSGGIP